MDKAFPAPGKELDRFDGKGRRRAKDRRDTKGGRDDVVVVDVVERDGDDIVVVDDDDVGDRAAVEGVGDDLAEWAEKIPGASAS